MAITDTDVAAFVAMAGERFTWDGVRGCSRPASDVRTRLRADLWERQGRICPQCGNGDNGQPLEFCHIVARGNGVKGFVPGNVFTGHSSCNASTKPQHDADGNVVSGVAVLLPSVHLARPDVVATEWTPFPVLRAMPRQ